MAQEVYINSDTPITWENLTDADEVAIEDAVMSAQLYDSSGVVRGSAISMTLLSGTTNHYRAYIPKASVTVADLGKTFYLEITATHSGLQQLRRIDLAVRYARGRP